VGVPFWTKNVDSLFTLYGRKVRETIRYAHCLEPTLISENMRRKSPVNVAHGCPCSWEKLASPLGKHPLFYAICKKVHLTTVLRTIHKSKILTCIAIELNRFGLWWFLRVIAGRCNGVWDLAA
jgi:hypothetical protein